MSAPEIESIETSKQKVRVISNNTAIETALIRIKGTNENGKPFDETERYTTVRVWCDLRRQIVSDHTSRVE